VTGKRILIASQYPLLDGGLNAILLNDPRVEAVKVCRGDTNELIRQARDLQTDVILLIGQPEKISNHIVSLLEDVTPCLIGVQTADNSMHIYRRQVLHETELDDIVTAILTDC
jgi:hypothetical protein